MLFYLCTVSLCWIGESVNPSYTGGRLLLLCSHSPNDVPPEPQRNVSIAAVLGAVRPFKGGLFHCYILFILDESICSFWGGVGSIFCR